MSVTRHRLRIPAQLSNFKNAQFHTSKIAEGTETSVNSLSDRLTTGLRLQEDQSLTLSRIETKVQSSNQAIASVPTQLDEIRKQLQE